METVENSEFIETRKRNFIANATFDQLIFMRRIEAVFNVQIFEQKKEIVRVKIRKGKRVKEIVLNCTNLEGAPF